MKNWLTTIFGAIAAAGTFLTHNSNATLSGIGHIAQTLGVFLLGSSAKDAKTKV